MMEAARSSVTSVHLSISRGLMSLKTSVCMVVAMRNPNLTHLVNLYDYNFIFALMILGIFQSSCVSLSDGNYSCFVSSFFFQLADFGRLPVVTFDSYDYILHN